MFACLFSILIQAGHHHDDDADEATAQTCIACFTAHHSVPEPSGPPDVQGAIQEFAAVSLPHFYRLPQGQACVLPSGQRAPPACLS